MNRCYDISSRDLRNGQMGDRHRGNRYNRRTRYGQILPVSSHWNYGIAHKLRRNDLKGLLYGGRSYIVLHCSQYA